MATARRQPATKRSSGTPSRRSSASPATSRHIAALEQQLDGAAIAVASAQRGERNAIVLGQELLGLVAALCIFYIFLLEQRKRR